MDLITSRDITLIADHLPSMADVLSGIKYIADSKRNDGGQNYHIAVKKNYQQLAEHIIKLWNLSNIPTVSKISVVNLIKNKRLEYPKIAQRMKRCSGIGKGQEDLDKFLNELMDIASCKCLHRLHTQNNQNLSGYKCKCANDKRIPDSSIAFYVDQRFGARQMVIPSTAGRDNEAHDNNDALISVISADLSTVSIADSCDANVLNETTASASAASTTTSTVLSDDILRDPNFDPHSSVDFGRLNNIDNLKKVDLTNVAMLVDAKQVSYRTAAIITSAALRANIEDIHSGEKDAQFRYADAPVISSNTLRNNVIRTRRNALAQHNHKLSTGMWCFQFDGKLCETLVTKCIDGTAAKRNLLVKREYYVVVKQPGDIFVAAVPSLEGSSAENIFTSLKTYFHQNSISLQDVVAIASDGAPVNTGVTNGIIRRFEEHLCHPVQWIICSLHLNELVFHRLFRALDHSSSSPQSFASELGQKLETCEQEAPVQFEAVRLDFERLPHNIDKIEFTNDQAYLWKMAKVINSGQQLRGKLTHQKPGKMNKSRWVTTMSRILRLYASWKNPPDILKILVRYIMKIYIPVLIAIKTRPSFTHGSRHFFLLVSLCAEYFPESEYPEVNKELVAALIHNSFYAHSENIILAMLTDDDAATRRKGYTYVINYILINHCDEGRCQGERDRSERDASGSAKEVRIFEKPSQINFSCRHYSELISMSHENISVPPVLQKLNLSLSDLQKLRDGNGILELENVPSHTQATERYIQITAQQVRRTSDIQSQQGAIINTASYRNSKPKSETVQNFKLPCTTSTSS